MNEAEEKIEEKKTVPKGKKKGKGTPPRMVQAYINGPMVSENKLKALEKMRATREKNKDKLDSTVYVVQNSENLRCYMGITNNELHRLKQHNGKARGGAWNT